MAKPQNNNSGANRIFQKIYCFLTPVPPHILGLSHVRKTITPKPKLFCQRIHLCQAFFVNWVLPKKEKIATCTLWVKHSWTFPKVVMSSDWNLCEWSVKVISHFTSCVKRETHECAIFTVFRDFEWKINWFLCDFMRNH